MLTLQVLRSIGNKAGKRFDNVKPVCCHDIDCEPPLGVMFSTADFNRFSESTG